jgi:hypothetical protein
MIGNMRGTEIIILLPVSQVTDRRCPEDKTGSEEFARQTFLQISAEVLRHYQSSSKNDELIYRNLVDS